MDERGCNVSNCSSSSSSGLHPGAGSAGAAHTTTAGEDTLWDAEYPEDPVVEEELVTAVPGRVVLVDVFGGVSASRVAMLAAGLTVVDHLYIEIHEPAKRIVQAWFGDVRQLGDVRGLAPDDLAKQVWDAVEQHGATAVVFACGFPCRELSSVNESRRGLRHGESARFFEAKALYSAILVAKPDKGLVVAIWECVQSMLEASRFEVTDELRGVDRSIELAAMDGAHGSWCRRPRLFWTNFWVEALSEEAEHTHRGLRHVDCILPLSPLTSLIEDGYLPSWHENPVRRFHTFTRCRPSVAQPAKPRGLATASVEALVRWKEDQHRYSPYQYEPECLVWKGDLWRCLNSNERIQMIGFPNGVSTASGYDNY